MLMEKVDQAEMVIGKKSEHFFFRIEKFQPFAVICDTKANKTIVNHPVHVGCNGFQNCISWQIGGIKNCWDRVIIRSRWT